MRFWGDPGGPPGGNLEPVCGAGHAWGGCQAILPLLRPLASHSHLLLVRGAWATAGSSHTKQNSRNCKLSRLLAIFSVPLCCFLKVSGARAQPPDLPGRILVDGLCAASLPPPQLHFSSAASQNPRRSLLERTVEIAKEEEAERLQPREMASI